jgi:Diacylglycerol kinase catalytic domain
MSVASRGLRRGVGAVPRPPRPRGDRLHKEEFVHRVVVLSLVDSCEGPRAPVLTCRDALHTAGAEVELVTARSDAEIDAALADADADAGTGTRLIVAAAADGQVRAVVRRMLRKYAPAPGQRPADLPADRTVPDLPPIGILPTGASLAGRLKAPTAPAAVAEAVLAGTVRRLDLLRNDGGSVTLDGVLVGGTDEAGRAVQFQARVEVDDTVLSDGREALLAAVVANADGYAIFDGLPLVVDPEPADGVLDVAVALAVRRRGQLHVEVRRTRGRAVAVAPRAEVPFLDDGVAGALARKRTWWMERAAWGVYAGL